jgi:hypothetical protein
MKPRHTADDWRHPGPKTPKSAEHLQSIKPRTAWPPGMAVKKDGSKVGRVVEPKPAAPFPSSKQPLASEVETVKAALRR